jgi:hypothetical protein
LQMLTHIHLKSGSSPGQAPLTFPLTPSMTIFVGPNNSGKSLLLREIAAVCAGGRPTHSAILNRIVFAAVDEATAVADFARLKRPAKQGERTKQGYSPVRVGGQDMAILDAQYLSVRLDPNSHPNSSLYAQYHVGPLTLTLDGSRRISLLNQADQGDLKRPDKPLAKIYMDNPKRKNWRKVVHEAFGLYPGVDSLEQGKLTVHFGKTPPTHERTHEDEIVGWVKNARGTGEVSDGVKAFGGILLEVYAGDPKVILVDEPEAFLHPSLARTLGKELATATAKEEKFVFAATHSADFIMGALQSGATVNIVRLTYANDIATARLLPSADLLKLMTDPRLRSVGILSGLFFDNVVVTEADADRAFYQEINERLLAERDERAIPHALFLNADNKHTVPSITAPLRKLGIPTAGVVDIDAVKDGGTVWTRQLEACAFPKAQHPSNQAHRKQVFDLFVAAAPNATAKPEEYFKRNGGVDLLKGGDADAANNLFDLLDQYGLFVVRKGEVETWLPKLGVPREKKGWRDAIFTAMGSDPKNASYVKPEVGDVWDFIGAIAKWLTNPTRKGIPG